MNVLVSPDASTLAATAAGQLTARLTDLQKAGRTPRVLLTGGTIAIATYERLAPDGCDWSDVEFWFGDERFVPAGHRDRNDQQARDAFLARLGASAQLVHAVADNDCSIGAAEAAVRYAATLPAEPFDIALFGIGPDGHLASLFPGFPQLAETTADVVAVFDSPKPPPVRVTLTLPRLNRSSAVWFLASGPEKADAVARALARHGSIDETPARGVRGIDETVWFLDDASASHL